jgi:hypothetical protein
MVSTGLPCMFLSWIRASDQGARHGNSFKAKHHLGEIVRDLKLSHQKHPRTFTASLIRNTRHSSSLTLPILDSTIFEDVKIPVSLMHHRAL